MNLLFNCCYYIEDASPTDPFHPVHLLRTQHTRARLPILFVYTQVPTLD
jgi:hypothetical protein